DNFDVDIDGDGIPDLVTDDQLSAANSVLTSARFRRVLMRGFNQETTLRFATMDLVRSNWRRYPKTPEPTPGIAGHEEGTTAADVVSKVETGQVTLEENSTTQPPYMFPPGVRREEMQAPTSYQSQNEASMPLKA